MRRIAPLIAGALAALGPIAPAPGQVPSPSPASRPAQEPRTSTPASAPARARQAPAQARPNSLRDPNVQRAASPVPQTQGQGQGQTPSQGQAESRAAAGDQQELDAILARWEQTSGKIETLYASFEQVDVMALVGEERHYQGKAYLRRPNRVVLQLEKKVVDDEGSEKYTFDRRILANGSEVVEFDGPTRQLTIYPMPKDDQQRTLEEGPLPFLFRMNVAEFKKRYRATLMPPTQEGTHRIAIYPQHPVDRDAFSVAVLILDARTLQPRSIHTLAPNGKDKQNYIIKDLRANVEIKPELFVWDDQKARKAQEDGWRIIRNPEPQPEQIGRQPGDQQPDLSPIPR